MFHHHAAHGHNDHNVANCVLVHERTVTNVPRTWNVYLRKNTTLFRKVNNTGGRRIVSLLNYWTPGPKQSLWCADRAASTEVWHTHVRCVAETDSLVKFSSSFMSDGVKQNMGTIRHCSMALAIILQISRHKICEGVRGSHLLPLGSWQRNVFHFSQLL